MPGELARFKELTWGHGLVMGRTTYESIGRPLPGRTTVVLTRDPAWSPGRDDVLVAHDLHEAIRLAAERHPDRDAVMVVGGAQVYAAAMPLATAQVLSEIPLEPAGDVHYPAYDAGEWAEERRESFEGYERVWLTRR